MLFGFFPSIFLPRYKKIRGGEKKTKRKKTRFPPYKFQFKKKKERKKKFHITFKKKFIFFKKKKGRHRMTGERVKIL